MCIRSADIKHTVATLCATVVFSLPLAAQEAATGELLSQLRDAEPAEAARLEREIVAEWSRSGSAAMDLLLERGREAVEAGDSRAAIEHLTALTDHAPDFAEGHVARAMAYLQVDLFGPAVADLERALAINPRDFRAIAGLGAIFERLDQPRMAYRAYREVQKIHPHHVDIGQALERLSGRVEGTQL